MNSLGTARDRHGRNLVLARLRAGRPPSGSIDANGNVRTIGYGEGISVVSQGRVSGSAGSGDCSISNGCTRTGVAHKT